ncbi:MAG: BatD family protein, partial [Mailhella sp.]|nr:BatD family protein [Mailhella sp.]
RPAEKVVRDADRRIDDALAALSERRSGDDRVAWWPGGEGSDFLTAYAADFLMTLREEGIGVPGGLLESICDAAERFAGTSVTDNEDARLKAYAIWVLSREGRVMTHELESLGRYVAENGGMKGDIAPLFIAAAREILHMDWSFTNLSTAGMDENSQFDALSAQGFRSVLTTKYFPNAKGDHAGDLVNAAMTAITSRGYSTFSAAQAIRAVLTSSPDSARALSAVRLGCIAGGSASAQGSDSLPMVSLEAPLCRRFTVDAPENSTLYWMLSTEGYDRTPPAEAESTGMEITRTYLSASGAPVTTVRQGEEITVRITARTYGDSPRDSVIADLLPGGFEHSESSADGTDGVMFADRREDRTLIFAGIGKSFTYTYKIRAVTRGTFTVPSATCEAMYDRTRRARTAAGTITVK